MTRQPNEPTQRPRSQPRPRSGGAKLIRALVLSVVIAVAVVVLFLYVFPWVEEQQQDPTLGYGAQVTAPEPQLTRSPR